MRYGFKQLLLLGAFGLSSLVLPKGAQAQTKDNHLPLSQRSYTQKITNILADGEITSKEVAELAYMFKQKEGDSKPALKRLSSKEAKRLQASDLEGNMNAKPFWRYDLHALNDEIKNSKEAKYIQLQQYNQQSKEYNMETQIFKIDPEALSYIVTEIDKNLEKAGMKDSVELRIANDKGSSYATKENGYKNIIYMSTADLCNMLNDQVIDIEWHEMGHIKLNHLDQPNTFEINQQCENEADDFAVIQGNYDIESIVMQYYNYFCIENPKAAWVLNDASKNEKKFVEIYQYFQENTAPSDDPHATNFTRVKTAIKAFGEALNKENGTVKTGIKLN